MMKFNNHAPAKVQRIERAGQSGQQRFSIPKSNSEIMEICKGFVPENTKKNTYGAIHVFWEWRSYRNKATAVM